MSQSTSHQYRDQRVLVTGATGFIGTHLCRRLLREGAMVHAASRSESQPRDNVAFHRLDIADPRAVDALIQLTEPDYVFHLASRVSGSRSISEVETTFEANLASTVHLLRAVTDTNCKRIVLAGSLEESPDEPPSSPYAAAKVAASMYAKMFFELYQTPVTVARLFMVYGPGQHDIRKLVPYVTVSLLAGRIPELTSGVRPVDWVYIDDVVDALMNAALSAETLGKTVDVGTGQLTTVKSVARQIGKLVGRGMPVFGAVSDRPLEQIRSADPTETEQIIGRQMTPLNVGLQRTIDWYRVRIDQGKLDAQAAE